MTNLSLSILGKVDFPFRHVTPMSTMPLHLLPNLLLPNECDISLDIVSLVSARGKMSLAYGFYGGTTALAVVGLCMITPLRLSLLF